MARWRDRVDVLYNSYVLDEKSGNDEHVSQNGKENKRIGKNWF
jgi:hypothetical protein